MAAGATRLERKYRDWVPTAQSLSKRTRAAYADQWRWFVQWCDEHGERCMPAEPAALAAYLKAKAKGGWKASSLGQALAAIDRAHADAAKRSPRNDPKVADLWRRLRKQRAADPVRKVPLSIDWLREMVAALPDGIRGTRDRAILLVGFAGGFRRSELVGLTVEGLRFHDEGLEVVPTTSTEEHSTTEGSGPVKLIVRGQNPATCPVQALAEWLDAAGIEEGPVFRPIDRHENVRPRPLTAHSIANLIKESARRAGLDPEGLSGHSLRAGFVSTAILGGASDAAIIEQTGHRSAAGLRSYVQRPRAPKKPASSDLGL